MAFEIGDKVLTTTGLYVSGEWRERGLKGKIVDVSSEFGGLLTVKFKGIDEKRFLRPEYLILRSKSKRPFKVGDTVALTKDVHTNAGTFSASSGADAEVIGLIPDSNLVEIKFLSGAEITVVEEVLTKTEVVEDKPAEEPEQEPKFEVGDAVVFIKDYGNESLVAAADTYAEVIEVLGSGEVLVEFDDYTTEVVPEDVLAFENDGDPFEEGEGEGYVPTQTHAVSDHWGTDEDPSTFPDREDAPQESPEVLAALESILRNVEQIKELLLKQGQGHVVNVFSSEIPDALFVTEEPEKEEEPAPEPVFKKAKEVVAGDLLYTEGGAYDKVSRVETTKGGYTSLYGAFGNQIVQVPSGRPLQVLEEV